MKRVMAAMGVAAVMLLTTQMFAQGRNFGGSWTVDGERTAAANAANAGVGGVMVGGGGARGGRGGGGGGDVGAGAVARSGGGGGGGGTMVAAGGRGGAGGGGGARGAGAAGPTTIALDATTFTIGSGTNSTTYRLDGSSQTIQTSRGEAIAKAVWKGDKLMIETTTAGPNGNIVASVAWYLDGESLVSESTTTLPDGTVIPARKTYYKKS